MIREELIKKILPTSVDITPQGYAAIEISNKDFLNVVYMFFDKILEISKADISIVNGYGEFDEEGKTKYSTCKEFLTGTFLESNEGYWFNWKEMYETTCLEEDFFDEYYNKMFDLLKYCEGKRYLVNNNTFFEYMITDGESTVGFPDWSRSGITDHLLDIALMDLEKPYLFIPEKFHKYCMENDVEINNFKERFLCMAYFKGLDTLRWHASIDDVVSCESIMNSMSKLEERITSL